MSEKNRLSALNTWANPEIRARRIAARHTPENRDIWRQRMIGNKFREGCKSNSGSFYKGYKHTIETRKKIGDACRGEKSHLWRGGLVEKNEKIRKSLEYKLWRESVFHRDNWTCVICLRRGVKIHADHIKPFSLFPGLRLAIDNGRTLCVDCHKKTETYGTNARWKIKKGETV